MNRFKSTFLEFVTKVTRYNKKGGFYENGINNNYSKLQEKLVNNSVTATQCTNIMASFLVGRGFLDAKDIKVGKEHLFTFHYRYAKSVSRQRGAFIHVKYDANFKKSSLSVIPFTHCVVGKKDSEKYNGKIGISEDFEKKIEWLDVYNTDEKVLKYQMSGKADTEPTIKQIKEYKGQIYFLNLDYDKIYPLSSIHTVQNDCDSEAQASIYKQRSLKKGFFGKTIIATKPLVDDFGNDLSEEDKLLKQNQETERDNFHKTIKSFMGAENSDGVIIVEREFDDAESIDDIFKVLQIKTNINDKLFQFTESSVSKNIAASVNNVPLILIKSNDSNMFGQSGDGIYQAKLFYQDNTTLERDLIVQSIKELTDNFVGFENITLEHQLLIEKKEVDVNK